MSTRITRDGMLAQMAAAANADQAAAVLAVSKAADALKLALRQVARHGGPEAVRESLAVVLPVVTEAASLAVIGNAPARDTLANMASIEAASSVSTEYRDQRIRAALAEGTTYAELARLTGLSRSRLDQIRTSA